MVGYGVGPFIPIYVNDGLTSILMSGPTHFQLFTTVFVWARTTSTSSSSESRRLEYRTVAMFMGRSITELTRSTEAASSTGTNRMGINGKCATISYARRA